MPGLDIYFVANTGVEPISGRFLAQGKGAVEARASCDGSRETLARTPAEADKGAPPRLEPGDSVFVLRGEGLGSAPRLGAARTIARAKPKWMLRLTDPETGKIGTPIMTGLGYFRDLFDPGVRTFAGTARCDGKIVAPKAPRCASGRYLSDLKRFGDIARVKVNGHPVASAWPPSVRLDVTKALQPGLNVLDEPLEIWLQNHTFRFEAKYEDIDFATNVYGSLVSTLLSYGTTIEVYFATTHVEATVALAKICLEQRQRTVVGKVAMDASEECPAFYRDADAATAVAQTRDTITRIQALQSGDRPLVLPVITPRFLPSCTDVLLKELGELAQETGCHIQTHCSESDWEVGHTAHRFGCLDTEALDNFGLLQAHTILAHANFVSQGDRGKIREHGAAIAHCPLSNFYFAGAVAPIRQMLEEDVHAGLGTDLSAGPSAFLLDSARIAMAASRALQSGVNPEMPAAKRGNGETALSGAQTFWLATRGAGQALGLPILSFEPGHVFDAVVVDAQSAKSALRVWPQIDWDIDIFEKIVRCMAPSDIAAVWVDGRCVTGLCVGFAC